MSVFRLVGVVMMLFFSVSTAGALQIPKVSVGLADVIAAVEGPFRPDRNGTSELVSVEADFFQRSTLADKKREFRADGRMSLKPETESVPLKFRFEYYRPTRHEVICDGRTLWVYLPENRQVIMSDVEEFFDPQRNNPLRDRGINFLQGLGRISKDFTITFATQATDVEGNYILELRPNRSTVTIQRLFITVSREAVLRRIGGLPKVSAPAALPPVQRLFAILSTTVVDHDGNSTTMEFSNIKENEMISDMFFSFDVPANARLVHPPTGR
ncbi:MAG TPA: outer membrane lipoprotein carrier protein LolA [Geobacteraceae bacterium]|nr:outer membrane lipoprotein carrier protein LolA [Geobacteraceae bacterium]